jgi:predicted MPP superfamily phosphohydrolase
MEAENRKSRRYGGRGRHHWYALLFLMRTLDVLLKLTRQHERGVRNACTELHGPIRPTMDRLRPLVSDVQVVGTDDVHYYFTDQAVHALEAARDAFTIALVHSPELFDVAADLGVDLYLCGHTHAGQVCLPGGRAVITHLSRGRRFYRGTREHRGMVGITNAGAGTSGVPVRFNTRGEVLALTLRPARGGPSPACQL